MAGEGAEAGAGEESPADGNRGPADGKRGLADGKWGTVGGMLTPSPPTSAFALLSPMPAGRPDHRSAAAFARCEPADVNRMRDRAG